MVTDEHAKAIQSVAGASKSTIEAVRDADAYVANVLGPLPSDLVGLAGADWIHQKRIENQARLLRETVRRLEERDVEEPIAPSASILIPLLEAARDEERDELVDAWARLLAASMDPSRSRLVRKAYIKIIQELEPIDAAVLANTKLDSGGMALRDAIARVLERNPDEVEIAFANLVRLEVMANNRPADPSSSNRIYESPFLTVLGREFVRAVYG